MATVRDILKDKGEDVWSVSPNSSVNEALKLMSEKDIGAILVLKDENIVGIFSERDFARKVIDMEEITDKTQVKELMSTRVLCVEPSDKVESCMKLMTENHFRHLPVLQNDTVIGMISIGDIVKHVIEDQTFTIEELGKYISGSY